MEKIDSQIEILNSRYERWGMWQTADKRWCVRLYVPGVTDRLFDSHLLTGAVHAAVDYIPKPVYPKQPLIPSKADSKIEKSTSHKGKWEVRYRGYFQYLLKSKTDAEAAIEKTLIRARQASEDWDREVGPLIAGKCAGIDFEWDLN